MHFRYLHTITLLFTATLWAGCGQDDSDATTNASTHDDTTNAPDLTEDSAQDQEIANLDATSGDDAANTDAANTDAPSDDASSDGAADAPVIPEIDYTSPIDLATYTGPTVSVSGHVMQFSQAGGRLEGAVISVLEFPGITSTSGADGEFLFAALPSGSQVSFVMSHPDYPPIQTGTFTLGTDNLERVTFQAPNHYMYSLLARISQVQPDPNRCQIATTVTRVGLSTYDGGTSHGEPDATVSIAPTPAETVGPIYFNLANHNTIFPDLELTQTTLDGGVLFLNTFPGEYTLSALKPDTTFTDVTIRCRPGFLVNASPPQGLQATEGGIGPIFTP